MSPDSRVWDDGRTVVPLDPSSVFAHLLPRSGSEVIAADCRDGRFQQMHIPPVASVGCGSSAWEWT